MTAAIGSRGRAARALAARPRGRRRLPRPGRSRASRVRLLSELHDAYARPLAYYHRHLPGLDATSEVFVATTDTFARSFMAVLSDVARRHHLYVAASNDQAPFRRTSDPAAVRALADPDRPRPRSVYVATSPHVGNETFLWGPRDVRRHGPPMLRNVVARNLKVPLTPIEQALALTPGPEHGPRPRAPTCGPTGCRARGRASGSRRACRPSPTATCPRGTDPCTDTARWYMRCLDRLGANVVVQADANPGAVDRPRRRRHRAVAAAVVDDVDVAGDGRPVGALRLQRHADARRQPRRPRLRRPERDHPARRARAGRAATTSATPRSSRARTGPDLTDEAGPKTEFLAIAPWVARDGPRAALRAVSARLAPGSGDRAGERLPRDRAGRRPAVPGRPPRRGCAGAR